MPDFLIEDTDTGIKLQVSGSEPPTQEDAHELVGDELKFLSTNLFSAPGGRFMLDVGPTSKIRSTSDQLNAIQNEYAIKKSAVEKAGKLATLKTKLLGDVGKWQSFYDAALPKFLAQAKTNTIAKPNATEQMLGTLPENSLMIVSHGSKSGGLYTEEGHKFTLHNIAQILGENTNNISSIINAACYGGRCEPKDYQQYFPNVNDVQYGETNKVNTLSIPSLERGEVFGPGVIPNRYQNIGGQWQQVAGPNVQQPETDESNEE